MHLSFKRIVCPVEHQTDAPLGLDEFGPSHGDSVVEGQLAGRFLLGAANQTFGLLHVLHHGLNAAVHAHLAVASGGALAEAAGHGQGLGAEGHGVAGLREGAVEVGVGAELRGGDIAVAGGEAVHAPGG